MQKETEYNQAVFAHTQAPYLAKRSIDETVSALDRLHEITDLTHRLQTTLTETATKYGVDIPTLTSIRQAQELAQIELKKYAHQKQIDVDAHRQMKEIDLEVYQQEAVIDFKAVQAEHLLAHETVLAIKQRLQALILERADIDSGEYPAPIKQSLLGLQDKLIEAFQVNLSEQMARHLLQAPEREDLEGDDPKNNG